jgi:hypothetical protein
MYRLAQSLSILRSQVDNKYPKRSKVSDGWIGDTAHSSRVSDHNPNSSGVVQALDLTHDPANGFNSYAFAEMLRVSRDPRIKYVISNGRIFSSTTNPWTWRKYTGSNSHSHHVHISVRDEPRYYDDARPWELGVGSPSKTSPSVPVSNTPATVQLGSRGNAVRILQTLLGLTADGIFGPITQRAVLLFQRSKGLDVDGIVGPITWLVLKKESTKHV